MTAFVAAVKKALGLGKWVVVPTPTLMLDRKRYYFHGVTHTAGQRGNGIGVGPLFGAFAREFARRLNAESVAPEDWNTFESLRKKVFRDLYPEGKAVPDVELSEMEVPE